MYSFSPFGGGGSRMTSAAAAASPLWLYTTRPVIRPVRLHRRLGGVRDGMTSPASSTWNPAVCSSGPAGRGPGMDHPQSHREGGGTRREHPSPPAAHRQVAPRLVEQPAQPMLEDVRPRHRDVHREPRRPHRPGELEKLAGVVGGTFSREDDAVVAGVLALEPQPMERVPDEWVEPVQGGRKAPRQLHARVDPPDVGELVQQHEPALPVRPASGVFGEQDHRSHHAPGQRDCRDPALEQLDVSPDRELPPERCEQDHPLFPDQPTRPAPQPLIAEEAHECRQPNHERPEPPDREQSA